MDEYSAAGLCIRATRGGGGGAGTKCGRWNPTSEQVKVLTELFRSGLRTPSTDQIQKISSELSFYGKIESKNVFYWFQNHKARERQKRRRVLVDECNHHMINNTTKLVSSTKSNLGDDDEMIISEHERVVETLQLFPLNSFSTQADHHHSDKLRVLFRDDCKENATSFTYNIGKEIDHSTLDLRLSFV